MVKGDGGGREWLRARDAPDIRNVVMAGIVHLALAQKIGSYEVRISTSVKHGDNWACVQPMKSEGHIDLVNLTFKSAKFRLSPGLPACFDTVHPVS